MSRNVTYWMVIILGFFLTSLSWEKDFGGPPSMLLSRLLGRRKSHIW